MKVGGIQPGLSEFRCSWSASTYRYSQPSSRTQRENRSSAHYPQPAEPPLLGAPLSIPLATVAFFQVITTLCVPAVSAADFDHSHRLFTAELRKYVRNDGVKYKQWQQHQEKFYSYLNTLKSVTAEDFATFSPDRKKAFWLNTYNALAIKLVLDNYPINGNNKDYPAASIRQIPDNWKAVKWKAAGRDIDLYTIKHQILRSEIADHRTHFAVVPAARGASPLQPSAYTEKGLDKRLTDNMIEFMKRPDHLQFDPEQETIRVSRVFRWFALDFIKQESGKPVFPPPPDPVIVQDFVMPFAPPEVQKQFEGKKAKVEFLIYDWALNESTAK